MMKALQIRYAKKTTRIVWWHNHACLKGKKLQRIEKLKY